MKKAYNIYYNDGVYYGTITFTDKSQEEIETEIQAEIEDNNKNINPLYHITRDNFKEIVTTSKGTFNIEDIKDCCIGYYVDKDNGEREYIAKTHQDEILLNSILKK